MAPVKAKLTDLLRNLSPIPFVEDEHVRDHWTCPPLFLGGVFEKDLSKDAGLRVALNLAECFNLGKVEWTGRVHGTNQFKLRIEGPPKSLQSTIWAAVRGLQDIYAEFKQAFSLQRDQMPEARFGTAFHAVLEEGLEALGSEDVSGTPGAGYISKDNICKLIFRLNPSPRRRPGVLPSSGPRKRKEDHTARVQCCPGDPAYTGRPQILGLARMELSMDRKQPGHTQALS